MKRTLLSLIAHWAGGEIHGDDVAIDAISNDTRSLGPGSLYVALRGERFDGHDFAADPLPSCTNCTTCCVCVPLPQKRAEPCEKSASAKR